MMTEAIFVLSYKRGDRLCRTKGSLNYISQDWKDRTFLVVREEESSSYVRACEMYGVRKIHIPTAVTEKDPVFDWSNTMDFILERIAIEADDFDSVVLMDDDLTIGHRLDLSSSKASAVTREEFNDLMDKLLPRPYEVPIAGIIPRGFSHAINTRELRNKSIAGMFALNVKFFKEHPQYRFFDERARFMGDRLMCLRTLGDGIENVAYAEFTHDSVTNTEGGCSSHRTKENHSYSAVNMKKMFPDLVDIRVKTNLGDTRLDLHIDWLKAFKGKTS